MTETTKGQLNSRDFITKMRARIEHHAHTVGGGIADGFIISALVHILANLYDNLEGPGDDDLTGPRLGVLARLVEEERRGNAEGLTPTVISRYQHVSRNTVSALLRGLEQQGLIERRLDENDRRLFRIRITESGRLTVAERAPAWIERANRIAAGLTPEERAELIDLLSKLFVSIHENATPPDACGRG